MRTLWVAAIPLLLASIAAAGDAASVKDIVDNAREKAKLASPVAAQPIPVPSPHDKKAMKRYVKDLSGREEGISLQGGRFFFWYSLEKPEIKRLKGENRADPKNPLRLSVKAERWGELTWFSKGENKLDCECEAQESDERCLARKLDEFPDLLGLKVKTDRRLLLHELYDKLKASEPARYQLKLADSL